MDADTARFSKADYMHLPEGFPAELIDGRLVKEPSPTHWHQRFVLKLCIRLGPLVGDRRVLPSPADVFVDDYNVLQPDVLVFSEEDRVGPDSGPEAIPIVVFEVLSPATISRDRDVKAGTYLRAGVREVWLVDPYGETIEVRTPEGSRVFAGEQQAESRAVPGFRVSFAELAAG